MDKVKRKIPEENEVLLNQIKGVEVTIRRDGVIHCWIPLRIVQHKPKTYLRLLSRRKLK